MDRYQRLFSCLQQTNQGAFIPFVTIGDPEPELSFRIIETLINAGADALELGIPFSDPLADGPAIQASALRALTAGVTPKICFSLLARIRQKYQDIPIGLLMYANLVYHHGIDNFYQQCAEAGVDSVLIADVPVEESEPFRLAAERHKISPVFICPPNASTELLEKISSLGKAYTYLLSRAGVTGVDNTTHLPIAHLVTQLQALNAPPIVQGFGISTAEQVKASMQAGVAGAISGSAVVKIIATHLHQPEQMLIALSQFVGGMKAATINR